MSLVNKKNQVVTIKHGEWETYRNRNDSIDDHHCHWWSSPYGVQLDKTAINNCTRTNNNANENNKIDQSLLSSGQQQQSLSNQGQHLQQTTTGCVGGRLHKCNLRMLTRIAPLIKRWLPFIQLSLFLQLMILMLLLIKDETNCDQDINRGQAHNNNQYQQQQSLFDLMPDLEDYQTLLTSQLNQQNSFDYLTNHQQQATSSLLVNQMTDFQREQEHNSPTITGQHNQQHQRDEDNQQNLSIGELLDSQSSAAQPATTTTQHGGSTSTATKSSISPVGSLAAASVADSGKGSSQASSSSPASPLDSSTLSSSSSSSSSSGASSSSSTNLSDQLTALSNLLQHIGPGNNNNINQQTTSVGSSPSISDSLISGVTNNILEPIRSQTTAMGNMVRKTLNAANHNNNNNNNNLHQFHHGASIQTASMNQRPILVGQQNNNNNNNNGINGNIEYDSDSNSINGNIEWPSFGNGTKPSLSSVKPFLLAALKVVPIKLGTVGWKLLQLIAFKKIYKAHHPKSGEIIIEQEMGGGKSHGGGGHHQHDKSVPTKSLQLEISAKPMMKTSKMGQAWPMGGGGVGGGSSWPLLDGALGAHSMMYQRHLLPANHQHSATAAAAAAAATAAAIQSQWVQNQFLNDNENTIFDGNNNNNNGASNQQQNSSNNKINSSNQQARDSSNQTNGNITATNNNLLAAATKRKRSSPANNPGGALGPFGVGGGNWFATPAHAYAAAAAAAAATAVTQQQADQQQHVPRFGVNQPFDSSAVSQDGSFLAGLVYQNLFDNAAAMAVQNTVKLPHMASAPSTTHPFQGNFHFGGFSSGASSATGANNNYDYLEQADSLPSGSSLTFGSTFAGSGDVDSGSGWPAGALPGEAASTNIFPSERSDAFSPIPTGAGLIESVLSGQHPDKRQLAMADGGLAQHYRQQQHRGLTLSDSLLALQDSISSGQQAPASLLTSMTDFDDTTAGKMLEYAMSTNASAMPPPTTTSLASSSSSHYHYNPTMQTRIGG